MIKWVQVQKAANIQLEGNYERKGVKEHIRREASFRCVYCALHENYLGGINAFHTEHYRPQHYFPRLAHVLSNLYYACPICNSFKSDTWPGEPSDSHDIVSYPDPAAHNYTELFDLDEATGKVNGRFADSKYVENQLYLNRPQLTMTRREYLQKTRLERLVDQGHQLAVRLSEANTAEATKLLKSLLGTLQNAASVSTEGDTIPRYERADVRR